MRFISLASGSRGNAYILEASEGALLIDCGIGSRTFATRCKAAKFDPCRLCGVVFTHNHVDHVKGVAGLHKKFPSLPLFANAMTVEATCAQGCFDAVEDFSLFEDGQSFEVGPFEICPFSITHDVPDPVGFQVKCEGETYFHATDLGAPLASVGKFLAEADMATLEANHDPILLSQSDRPESLKCRIRGSRGHLSNDEAAELIEKYASPKLKYLHLAHLSHECNEGHLAEKAIAAALRRRNLLSVRLAILEQDNVFAPTSLITPNMI